jgi:hypothetical protein
MPAPRGGRRPRRGWSCSDEFRAGVVGVPLTSSEDAVFRALDAELTAITPDLDTADGYYDGLQRLEQLGLAIPPELHRFVVIVNWPRVAVDAVADRLDVKGFRLPGTDVGDSELWRVWQANGMDEQDMLSRLDYLVYGRTYKCVGANEDDPATPLITVESPRQMITTRDARTGKVAAALRRYGDADAAAGIPPTGLSHPAFATLYLPDHTVWLEWSAQSAQWLVEARDDHLLGMVPVVPTFRRRRTKLATGRRWQGTSAMADVIPVTDSAARNITNAQVAQETHAVPQRGVLGASKGDFVDQNGKQLTVWEAYFGAVWALSNPNAKTFQFDASDMSNFERMMNLYARLASGVSGLPPNYFGLAADDAASADAIRSRESRLVKIAERDQVALGNGDEDTLRIAERIRTGAWNPDLIGMETLWYDAGTPTVAQRADAVVKMFTATDGAGRALLPREMAMEELGWSPAKISRALALLAVQEQDPYLVSLLDKQPTERAASIDAAVTAATTGAGAGSPAVGA